LASSVTGDIWTWHRSSGTYTQISDFAGEDLNPVFSADGTQVYYLSEEQGSMNVFRRSATGGQAVQVTFMEKDPVRHLSISTNGTLCFSYRGALHTMASGGQPVRLRVTTAVDARHAPEKTLAVTGKA